MAGEDFFSSFGGSIGNCSSFVDLAQVIKDLEDFEGASISDLIENGNQTKLCPNVLQQHPDKNAGENGFKSIRACPVCEDGEAGDHVYYGGRACHSCRVFFRRCVRGRLDSPGALKCEKGRNGGLPDFGKWCLIWSKTRKGCKACRLARCVHLAGLDRFQVDRNARCRRGGSENDIVPKMKTEEDPFPPPPAAAAAVAEGAISSRFGEDEKSMLLFHYDDYLHKNHDKYFEYFAARPADMEGFASSVSSGAPFRASMHAAMCRMDEMSTVNFCFEGVPEMRDLTPWDKLALVEANAGAMFGMAEAWFLSPWNLPFYVGHLLKYGQSTKVGNPVLQMMLSSALPLASDYRHRSPWGVWSVYLSACCRREHEESWSRLNAVFTRNGSLLRADNVVTVLLMHIILFATDKPDQFWEEKHKIVSIQRRYIGLLERYLASTSTKLSGDVMSSALGAIFHARRFYELHKRRVEAAQEGGSDRICEVDSTTTQNDHIPLANFSDEGATS